jgi:enamine deaminase RidA (YjgF/YER057c/UK114 family)
MGAEARLKELGIVLPELQKPVPNYLPYRLVGNVLYLAGQGPRDSKGVQLTGKLGVDISIEEGYRRARLVGLGLLAAMRDASARSTGSTSSSNCSAWSTPRRI